MKEKPPSLKAITGIEVSKSISNENLHEVSEDRQTARNHLQNSRILGQYRTEVKNLSAGAKQTRI